jgi:hypothetical protein
MTVITHRLRRGLSIALLVVLAALAAAAASGCGRETGAPTASPSASPSAVRAVSGEEAARLLGAGCVAIVTRDAAAWRAATPSTAAAVRAGLDRVYAHLSPLTWSGLHVEAAPVPREPGVFDVRFVGGLDPAGPPDRVVAELVLAFGRSPSGPVIAGDCTPQEVVVQDVLALQQPRELRGAGCVVVYDRTWRVRAAGLARLVPAARAAVLRFYDLHDAAPVAVFVYSSSLEVTDSVGVRPDQVDHRIKFFSLPARRLASDEWSPTDIGVVAPALTGREAWAPTMLRHEMAHAFTLGWFFLTAHAPDFLQEGLAVAAEGTRSYAALQRDLRTGGPSIPLLAGMQTRDIWSGRSSDEVSLAYAEAGATILYVRERWGVSRLRRWVHDMADCDQTAAAIKGVVRRDLGLSWPAFLREWRAYVFAL